MLLLAFLMRVAEDEPGEETKNTKASFPGIGEKEATEAKRLAVRISCSLFPGESWHLTLRIDDPDPVAVASLGSSLSHSA
jgi:hypothetical protein